jgi:Uma2 family endonuclease
MSSATTDITTTSSATVIQGPLLTVPTLEELERMTAVPDRRAVFKDVDWSFYERLVDSIPEGANLHVDYDGKDLEVMGKGRKHEGQRELLGYFVRVVTAELRLDYKSLGETTWKRAEISRGLEADQCYYFLPEKLAANAAAEARCSDDIADYPNPDLAIEVDVSAPQTDRAGICAALRVAEVWRLEGGRVVIERLGQDGRYAAVEASGFLYVTADEVRRWLVEEDSRIDWAWAVRLQAWVRAELAGRMTRE